MDLRFRPQARTTKDVDLTILITLRGSKADFAGPIRERLQEAADFDLEDYVSYRIGEPKQELTNAPGGGARYSCEAMLLGKVYQKFHIDAGCGDAAVGEPERLTGDKFLDFAGVEPATVLAISKSKQLAEKIHAYSYPWQGRLNTRTKDLVASCSSSSAVRRGRLRLALPFSPPSRLAPRSLCPEHLRPHRRLGLQTFPRWRPRPGFLPPNT
jgi:hypothetical protein